MRILLSTLLTLALSTLGLVTIAQEKKGEIQGIVHELESSQRLQSVLVKNLRTKTETKTDAQGQFRIEGLINDYLTFTQVGYEVDTAFIYQGGMQRIYLVRDNKSIVIDEITVNRMTDSRLSAEIAKAKLEGQVAEASQQRGGLRLSPSRLFGSKGKQARKNLDMLAEEKAKRKVDQVFTNMAILSVVQMTDTELALFKERFRPTVSFIESASPEDLRAYILESYSKFIKK